MVMRDPARGGADACREKAVKKVTGLIEKLPSGHTEEQRFDALKRDFDTTVACAQRCADNFLPEEFIARDIPGTESAFGRECMLTALEESAYRLAALEEKMAESPLSRVNGRSVAFADCAKAKKIIFDQIGQAREVNQSGPYSIGNIDDDCDGPGRTVMKGLQRNLVLSLNYLAGIVLVFEDMLAA